MKFVVNSLVAIVAFVALSGCATPGFRPEMRLADAELNPVTVTEHTLKWLPGPQAPIPVAVYGLADETGAFQPSATGQNLSRAVTQGPTPILIKALQDAGNRRWFSVIERENLQNLLRERQIILDMRRRYLGEEELNREALPALKFAGILIEGAITGFDTNTITGGAGARYLGIGGNTEYREDAVSIYLRAVSVKTGEVLISISSEQRIASIAVQGNAFRFVSFQELLEAEAGITMNQPRHLAVRQALEKAVYGMVVEGAELGLWAFKDQAAGDAAVNHYRTAYAPAFNERYNDILPYEFFAAAGNVRKQNRILKETRDQQEAQRLAALQPQRQPQQISSQTAQANQASARVETQAKATPPSAEPVRQQVQADPPQPAPVQTARVEPVAPVQQQAPAATAQPPVNRALADALAAIAATEGVNQNNRGQVEITPDTARSLVALRDGLTGATGYGVDGAAPEQTPEDSGEQTGDTRTARQALSPP
ncbi:MAG: CsgG/HfaB family protein [Pseudomonadota bacterium]